MGLRLATIALIAPFAFAQTQPSAPRPAFDAFEVATIKPAAPDPPGRYARIQSAHRFYAKNFTLKMLIALAWNLTPSAVSGGPAWIDSDRYDILAEAPNEIRPSHDEQMSMLRKLTVDRFRLAFHRERKEFSIYALTIAKAGPKLTPRAVSPDATPEGPPPLIFLRSRWGVGLPAQNATISEFASVMQRAALNRPVVDRTGLSGRFDFDLEWAPDETQFDGAFPRGAVPADSAKPDLFTAIQQQLGLRLEATKGSIEAIVIDRAEKPTAN